MGWWPCCCDNCGTILLDDFNRASLGAAWTQQSGAWSLAGNQLVPPGTGRLVGVTPAVAGESLYAEATWSGLVDGDRVRVLVAYQDAANYLAAELEPDQAGSMIRAIERVAGVETILREVTLSGGALTGGTLRACYDHSAGNLGVSIATNDQGNFWIPAGGRPGDQAGLETIGVSSAARADNYRLEACDDGQCGRNNCDLCAPALLQTVAVEITGLANGVCTANHPTGTYLLDAGGIAGPLYCTYSDSFPVAASLDNSCLFCTGGPSAMTISVYLDQFTSPVPFQEAVIINVAGDSYTFWLTDLTGLCAGSWLTATYNSLGGVCASAGLHAWDFPNATVRVRRVS